MDWHVTGESATDGGTESDADGETPDTRGESLTRRQWVALTATTVGGGLAGCSGGGGDDGNGNGDPNGGNNTTGNGDPNGGNGDPNGDPPPGQEELDAVIEDMGLIHEGMENIIAAIDIENVNEVDVDEIESIVATERERISDAEEALDNIDDSGLQSQIDEARDVIDFQSEFLGTVEQFVTALRQTREGESLLEQDQLMDAADTWEEAGNQMNTILDAVQDIKTTRAELDTEFEPPLDYSEPIIEDAVVADLEAASLFINGAGGFAKLLAYQEQGIERVIPGGEFNPDADFAAAREDFQTSADAGGTASETLAEAANTGNLSDEETQQAGEWRQAIQARNEVNRRFVEGVIVALDGDIDTAETIITDAFAALSQDG